MLPKRRDCYFEKRAPDPNTMAFDFAGCEMGSYTLKSSKTMSIIDTQRYVFNPLKTWTNMLESPRQHYTHVNRLINQLICSFNLLICFMSACLFTYFCLLFLPAFVYFVNRINNLLICSINLLICFMSNCLFAYFCLLFLFELCCYSLALHVPNMFSQSKIHTSLIFITHKITRIYNKTYLTSFKQNHHIPLMYSTLSHHFISSIVKIYNDYSSQSIACMVVLLRIKKAFFVHCIFYLKSINNITINYDDT